MSTFYVLPAVLVAAAIASPAAAGDRVETVTVAVETHDLDLAEPDAQRRLKHRVTAAINEVCSYGRLDLRAARRASECRALARARAGAQVRFAIAQARLNKARLAAMAKMPPA